MDCRKLHLEAARIEKKAAYRYHRLRMRLIGKISKRIEWISRAKTPRPDPEPETCVCVKCTKGYLAYPAKSKTVCPVCVEANYARMRRASRARYKALRRARMKINAESFDPYEVFARDKWRCQLCGIKTPQRLRNTYEPNAPELDHIIPLSKRGAHTRVNAQCACRQCNLSKGDKERGQLWMF